MITVSQLTLGFKGCEPILDNVSFHLKRGEILSVLWPNGAGKTTLWPCCVKPSARCRWCR